MNENAINVKSKTLVQIKNHYVVYKNVHHLLSLYDFTEFPKNFFEAWIIILFYHIEKSKFHSLCNLLRIVQIVNVKIELFFYWLQIQRLK